MLQKRIALIAGTYRPKHCGVAHYTAQLRTALLNQGIESVVLTTQSALSSVNSATEDLTVDSTLDPAVKPAVDPNVNPTVLGVVQDWGLKGVWQLAIAIRNLQASSPVPIDLIHIQHAAGTYGFQRAIFLLPLLLKGMGCRLPIVTTLHEYGWWDWQPAGVPTKMLRSLKTWGQQWGWWDEEDGFLITLSDAILTTNRQAEQCVIQRLPQIKPRLYSVPIGANVGATAISRAQARQAVLEACGWSEEVAIAAFFGFLHPVKGIETLLLAFQQVLAADPKARLLLVGGVESLALPDAQATAYWNQLQDQIAALNLQSAVQMTGYLKAEQVSMYLTAADAGVLPFNHGVTLKSGSLLTLLSHRLPVIATRIDSTDLEWQISRITAEGDAWVHWISPRQVDELAEALLHLLTHADDRDRLSHSGLAFSRQFSWDAIATTHAKIYHQVS
nr:glycosyltransferase [Oculatellaceae cyanobacterium Prado106]